MKSINSKLLVSNIAVFVVLLFFWLIVDYIDVKIARVPSIQYDIVILLSAAWVLFFWANWRFSKLERNIKFFVVPLLSLVLLTRQ